ncbi:hypothetical protein LTR53_008742 [Teratosphaeriaceae sp. CCFEE 6253]|nr:hypothetical protein LTR53_008742 [Teratosphaeriaceae sp. CCFEE 6253]
MAREHLSNDAFFTQLAALIEQTQQKGHGSVYLTQKRLSFDPASPTPTSEKIADDPLWDLHPPSPLPLLIRATDGKSHTLGPDGTAKGKKKNAGKVKLSTVVQPQDLEAFFGRYGEVCKAGMTGLRKRDRRGRKKDKKKKGGKGVGEEKGAAADAKGKA